MQYWVARGSHEQIQLECLIGGAYFRMAQTRSEIKQHMSYTTLDGSISRKVFADPPAARM